MLNSYGGSCNAATRMYDILRSYPGSVTVTISGTAASAATVFIQGADHVQMTPGSLLMIHDPATLAWGNEQDLRDTIHILQACKESIINMYKARSPLDREDIGKLMSKTTWMDATEAVERGFVDGVTNNGMQNRAESREHAEACVNAWYEKHGKPKNTSPLPAAAPVTPVEGARGVPQDEPENAADTDEVTAQEGPVAGAAEPAEETTTEAVQESEEKNNCLFTRTEACTDEDTPEAEPGETGAAEDNAAEEEAVADEAEELQTLRDETAKWAAEMLAQMV